MPTPVINEAPSWETTIHFKTPLNDQIDTSRNYKHKEDAWNHFTPAQAAESTQPFIKGSDELVAAVEALFAYVLKHNAVDPIPDDIASFSLPIMWWQLAVVDLFKDNTPEWDTCELHDLRVLVYRLAKSHPKKIQPMYIKNFPTIYKPDQTAKAQWASFLFLGSLFCPLEAPLVPPKRQTTLAGFVQQPVEVPDTPTMVPVRNNSNLLCPNRRKSWILRRQNSRPFNIGDPYYRRSLIDTRVKIPSYCSSPGRPTPRIGLYPTQHRFPTSLLSFSPNCLV
jgi:hypothetical protein